MSRLVPRRQALLVLTLIYVIAIVGGGWGLLVQPIDNLRWAVASSLAVTDPSQVVMILSSVIGMAALVLVAVALATTVANSLLLGSPRGSAAVRTSDAVEPTG